MTMEFTRSERLYLLVLAIVGLLGINGMFVWAMLARPEAVRDGLAKPPRDRP